MHVRTRKLLYFVVTEFYFSLYYCTDVHVASCDVYLLNSEYQLSSVNTFFINYETFAWQCALSCQIVLNNNIGFTV